MKRKLLFFILPVLFFISCKNGVTLDDAITKIEFYRGWELGEGNRVLIGSTEDPDFVLKYAYFDLAIYPAEPLQTLNLIVTSDGNTLISKDIDVDDYEVMRRRYNNFGYYVLTFYLDDYINTSAEYTLEIKGSTKTKKKYIYTYNGKTDFVTY